MSKAVNRKVSGVAALLHSFLGLVTLFVVISSLGIVPNPDQLAELARSNPFPLILLDLLKILSSITAMVLIIYFYNYFKVNNLGSIKWGSIAGGLSVICLLINAFISLSLVLSASPEISPLTPSRISKMEMVVIIFGIGSVFFNGFWYLVINRTALKNKVFSASFCYLGIALGVISLIPPLSLIVLLLMIVWSLWLGIILLRN
ncbi:DUF4386 family protein [Cyclobacterium jeungdonense]|uniref:DUF4386 family protein n=1 Tax=Cyclobacterium jeungdonense TaxID=708087 RepID=A0ABT8C2I6_9BACT|nr:DUF4386 family protein [Cyclobacterium jeungdonense]MDN3686989.1 DUF4386 family protein [Cyclobacterium jeungdonense]